MTMELPETNPETNPKDTRLLVQIDSTGGTPVSLTFETNGEVEKVIIPPKTVIGVPYVTSDFLRWLQIQEWAVSIVEPEPPVPGIITLMFSTEY